MFTYIEKLYLISIRDNGPYVHEFNNEFSDINFDSLQLENVFIGGKKIVYNGERKTTLILNNYINEEFYFLDNFSIISYKVNSCLLKKKMDFDIEAFIKERKFIDIIKYSTAFHSLFCKAKIDARLYDKEDKTGKFKQIGDIIFEDVQCTLDKINLFRELFCSIVDVLFTYDGYNSYKPYTKKRKDIKNSYDLLLTKALSKYSNYNFSIDNDPLNYNEMNKLTEESLDENTKTIQELIQNAELKSIKFKIVPKENKHTKQEKVEKEIIEEETKESIYDYKEIHNDLRFFINGGDPNIYESIIENGILPENVPLLEMKSKVRADIVRFADCFNIRFCIINKVFNLKVSTNNRDKVSVNDLLRVLRKYNNDLYRK